MNKRETIKLLKEQLPGFYSVEQVIKMIEDIDDNTSSLNEIKNQVETAVAQVIESMSVSDIVDYDSAEFYLDGNTISLDRVNVNEHFIIDCITNRISEIFNN